MGKSLYYIGTNEEDVTEDIMERQEREMCPSSSAKKHLNLTLTGSNVRVLWGSEVLDFTHTQFRSLQVDAVKATYQLSRGQNAATTMFDHAQAAGPSSTLHTDTTVKQ